MYKHTHVSVRDDSPAMLVSQTDDTITLVNECGDEWTDPADQWRLIGSYTLFYAAQDVSITSEGLKVLDTWSVYSQRYESIDSPEPIEGSTVLVSGNHTEASAQEMAVSRQRASYALARKGHAEGCLFSYTPNPEVCGCQRRKAAQSDAQA